MAHAFCPRLSDAGEILPLLRTHIFVAASRNPRAAGSLLDLVPILDEGLFGYELISAGDIDTCLTVGCMSDRRPVVREDRYGVSPNALRLATSNGRTLDRRDRALRPRRHQRDREFSDWSSAATFALTTLGTLCPDRPPYAPMLAPAPLRSLEWALNIANARLAQWDPFIHFFGLPNEAQLGYLLDRADDGRGQLVFCHPNTWMLRWTSSNGALDEHWSLVPPVLDEAGQTARA